MITILTFSTPPRRSLPQATVRTRSNALNCILFAQVDLFEPATDSSSAPPSHAVIITHIIHHLAIRPRICTEFLQSRGLGSRIQYSNILIINTIIYKPAWTDSLDSLRACLFSPPLFLTYCTFPRPAFIPCLPRSS